MEIIIPNLTQIKSQINLLIGKPVCVTTKEHRGKIDTFKGELNAVYPAFFSIKLADKNNQTVTFNYSDILTETILLKEISE